MWGLREILAFVARFCVSSLFTSDKLPFGYSCPVGERACVGARLKVQAKAKLDQISGAWRHAGARFRT